MIFIGECGPLEPRCMVIPNIELLKVNRSAELEALQVEKQRNIVFHHIYWSLNEDSKECNRGESKASTEAQRFCQILCMYAERGTEQGFNDLEDKAWVDKSESFAYGDLLNVRKKYPQAEEVWFVEKHIYPNGVERVRFLEIN
jgi:hypothetical protein